MLEVQRYDWADVIEPTEAELAEIGAAIEAAPPVSQAQFCDEWVRCYPVKQAAAIVGPPNGSSGWLIRFTAELFAQTEAWAPIRGKADEALYHAMAWCSLGVVERKSHLRALLAIMPIGAVVQYLSEVGGRTVAVEDIERSLFPQTPLDRVRAALAMVQDGTPAIAAAKAVGVSYQKTFRPFLRLHGIETEGMVTKITDDAKACVVRLASAGFTATAAHEAAVAEGHRIGLTTVKNLMKAKAAA